MQIFPPPEELAGMPNYREQLKDLRIRVYRAKKRSLRRKGRILSLEAQAERKDRELAEESGKVMRANQNFINSHQRFRTKVNEVNADRQVMVSKVAGAETRAEHAEKKTAEAEKRATEAEKRAVEAEKKLTETELKLKHAEQKMAADSMKLQSMESKIDGALHDFLALEAKKLDREFAESEAKEKDSTDYKSVDVLNSATPQQLSRIWQTSHPVQPVYPKHSSRGLVMPRLA